MRDWPAGGLVMHYINVTVCGLELISAYMTSFLSKMNCLMKYGLEKDISRAQTTKPYQAVEIFTPWELSPPGLLNLQGNEGLAITLI